MNDAEPKAPSFRRPPPSVSSAHDSEQESRLILERVARESDTLGASALARAVRDARRRLLSDRSSADDPIEVWATRIGRILGVLFAVYLLAHAMRLIAGW